MGGAGAPIDAEFIRVDTETLLEVFDTPLVFGAVRAVEADAEDLAFGSGDCFDFASTHGGLLC
jgi:hypothetical protein